MKPRQPREGKYLDLHQFADKLSFVVSSMQAMRELLPKYGKELLIRLCGGDGLISLRKASRTISLSPTYLSQVMSGKATISHDAYMKAFRLYRDLVSEEVRNIKSTNPTGAIHDSSGN